MIGPADSPRDSPMPAVSVVIVADYAAGSSKAQRDLRRLVEALAQQDYAGNVEIVLCENAALLGSLPAELARRIPSLKIISDDATGSYELKNAAVRAASAEIVAMVDADCAPDPDWLRVLVGAMSAKPRPAVVNGRTVYAGRGRVERILSLLSRAYVDAANGTRTPYISNNNAAWRRSVFLAHPLPVGLGPFAGRIQSERIRRAGGAILFEPAMRVVHDFEGWSMEADIRRNCGYGTIVARLHDASMPWARLTRLGIASVPLFAVGKMLVTWGHCLRYAAGYGVRWHEVPLALAFAAIVHGMEVPGMLLAFRRRAIARTQYR